MQTAPYVEALLADLTAIAAVGDDATAQAAARLAAALRASAGMRLLDVLSEAALELSGQLPGGHVEVRLAGQDPSLVYVEDEPAPTTAPGGGDDALSVRITLRLPESLKAAVESAAARDGVSVNTWLVRALARAVSGWASRGGPGSRLQGFARS
jgi:HicB family